MDRLELESILRDKKIRESNLELQRMAMGLNANNNYTDRTIALKPGMKNSLSIKFKNASKL